MNANDSRRWFQPDLHRYYQVQLVQDLFGDWTLVQAWGGLESKRGRVQITWVPSHEDGEHRLAAIAKRRQQHGYQSCDGSAPALRGE